MDSLPGAAEAGERLKQTSLRDFGPPQEDERRGPAYRLAILPQEAPLPGLYKYALTLIGLAAYGPGEKVAWWVSFTYKGESCELAHQKFGLRLYLRTEAPEEERGKTLAQVAKQLRSSMRTVEADSGRRTGDARQGRRDGGQSAPVASACLRVLPRTCR